MIVGAVTHCPGVAEHATPVLLRPATAGSFKIAPVTSLGPLFVTRIVYMVVPFALTLATPSVLVIAKSEIGFTVSVSLALLLPGVGSVVPTGATIVAAFVTLPLVAVTFAVTVIS